MLNFFLFSKMSNFEDGKHKKNVEKITKFWIFKNLMQHLFKITEGEKCYPEKDFCVIFVLQNSIIYDQYEPINFCSAGLLKIPLIVRPLVIEKGFL